MYQFLAVILMAFGLVKIFDLVVATVDRIGSVASATGNNLLQNTQQTLSNATGGLIQPPALKITQTEPLSTSPLPAPSPSPNPTVQALTNPWLWAFGGLFVFGATYLTRQTRGLLRDVGSGVQSTRSALKNDLAELNGEPDSQPVRRRPK